VPHKVAQPDGVNSSDLFHQDSRRLTFDIYFWPEGRGPGTTRSRGHENNGSWQEFIGLNDNPIAPALLLVPTTWARPQNVNITPEHAGSP
jgi:hypothetical protein